MRLLLLYIIAFLCIFCDQVDARGESLIHGQQFRDADIECDASDSVCRIKPNLMSTPAGKSRLIAFLRSINGLTNVLKVFSANVLRAVGNVLKRTGRFVLQASKAADTFVSKSPVKYIPLLVKVWKRLFFTTALRAALVVHAASDRIFSLESSIRETIINGDQSLLAGRTIKQMVLTKHAPLNRGSVRDRQTVLSSY